MNSDVAFKAGFMARCLSDGSSMDEIPARVKQAHDLLKTGAYGFVAPAMDPIGSAVGAVGAAPGALMSAGSSALGGLASAGGTALDALLSTAKYGIPLAMAAPPLAGLAAGYAGSKMTDVSDLDVDEMKKKEQLHELRHQTDFLNRLALSRR